jgi:ribonuclease D
MIPNSFICKLINVQAREKENNEKKIRNEDEISKLTKAPPKDTAALDKRSVLAKVNSQESGR